MAKAKHRHVKGAKKSRKAKAKRAYKGSALHRYNLKRAKKAKKHVKHARKAVHRARKSVKRIRKSAKRVAAGKKAARTRKRNARK